MQCNEPMQRVVIPARYGSSRLPGKPLIDLAGKPMIVRVYESVRAALPEHEIIVASDDNRIMSVLAENSVPAVMTGSKHKSGMDRVAEVARLCNWDPQDLVINVQGDEPLIPDDLLQAFSAFCKSRSGASMATIAVPINAHDQLHDPNVVKVTLDSNDRAITFSRASLPFNRDAPAQTWMLENYQRHVGIYAYSNATLQQLTTTPECVLERIEKLEQLRAQWLGISIEVLRWSSAPPAGVDSPEDALRVGRIFNEACL